MTERSRVTLIPQTEYRVDQIAEKILPFFDLDGVRRVFVKPNLVIDPQKGDEASWAATVTNAALIEAVLLCLREKAQGPLRVVVGDAPMARSNHTETVRRLGLDGIVKKYHYPPGWTFRLSTSGTGTGSTSAASASPASRCPATRWA